MLPRTSILSVLPLGLSLGFRTIAHWAAVVAVVAYAAEARAQLDIQFNVIPTGFSASQLVTLQEALDTAEALWETKVTGYQPGITVPALLIDVQRGGGLADAIVRGAVSQGGFVVPTEGRVRVSTDAIDLFASWDGSGPDSVDPNFIGLNYLDDIIAHEVGHVLGIGIVWTSNGVYATNSYQYTGEYGVRAFQREFDPNATFIPVENGGGSGTRNSHWDQRMRSDANEGDPSDPWSLDPRQGIVDAQGRDFSLELMSGALDPDYGEPFLSNTTLQSLRDLGYTVVPEPSSLSMVGVACALVASLRRRLK